MFGSNDRDRKNIGLLGSSISFAIAAAFSWMLAIAAVALNSPYRAEIVPAAVLSGAILAYWAFQLHRGNARIIRGQQFLLGFLAAIMGWTGYNAAAWITADWHIGNHVTVEFVRYFGALLFVIIVGLLARSVTVVSWKSEISNNDD